VDDDQLTKLLILIVRPLLNVPVATSCCRFPAGTVGLIGAMEIEVRPESDPVPDRLTVWGLVLALSVMLRVPPRVPSAVGVNVTEIVQPKPAAKVFGEMGQFDVWPKSPEVEIAEMVSATV